MRVVGRRHGHGHRRASSPPTGRWPRTPSTRWCGSSGAAPPARPACVDQAAAACAARRPAAGRRRARPGRRHAAPAAARRAPRLLGPPRRRGADGPRPGGRAGPSCSSRSSPASPTSGVEAVYAARDEMARTVDDVLARRTRARVAARAAAAEPPPARRPRCSAGELGAGRAERQAAAEVGGTSGDAARRAELPTRGPGPRPSAGDAGRDRAPTPVTPVDADARAQVTDRLGAAPGRPSPTPCCERLAGERRRGRAPTTRRRAEAGRDWWPLAIALGRRGARSPPARRPWSRPTDDRAGGRRAGRAATTRRRPGDPAGGTQRGVRRQRSRSSAGSPSTCAAWSGSSTSTRRRSWPTCRPGTFGPDLEAELRARGAGSPSGTGPSRWTCPPSAAGSPAAAPGSTRPATARSRTW